MAGNPPAGGGPSLLLIELCLSAIALALAFYKPRLGSTWFTHIELAFARLARRRGLSVAVVGLSALLLRLAVLPFCPIPLPFVQDDFSFLLAANTFAAGRLTNPTPTMWVHFESIQIDMKPTYMSMYFPGQGLILAAGKVLFGHPWFSLLCFTALMCAVICWMLQAWLPPGWALLGGMVAVLRLGLFSYWINTYSGGASIAALGGGLVLGGLPRFMRAARFRDALLIAAGFCILAITRPYEGLLLSLPIAVVLGRWILVGNDRPTWAVLLRRTAFPLAMIIATGSWMSYYDYRVNGNPLTPPYKINRATYAVVPYWVWQHPSPEPVYHHKVIRDFYVGEELGYFKRLRTVPGFLSETLFFKPLRAILFFAGFALVPPLILLPRALQDRRTRFLVICVSVVIFGVMLETFLIPHYLAAITAALYALGLQAMRHLRLWRPGGQPVGAAIIRFAITLCIFLAVLRLWAAPLHIQLTSWPSGAWASTWSGPGRLGTERAQIEATLEQLPGKQLVMVRYSPRHSSLDEWVYNAPDIDGSKVIWAREMDGANNCKLFHYYKDRQVWLVQPDLPTAKLSQYLTAQKIASLCAGE
jgi:hypothetical protein